MKTLNLKFLLTGIFMLAISASVFFTSCSEDLKEISELAVTEEENTETDDSNQGFKTISYSIPISIFNKSKEAINDYVNGLDEAGWEKARESYRISRFLAETNLESRVSINENQIYGDLDLSAFLSEKELDELKSYDAKQNQNMASCKAPYKPSIACGDGLKGVLIHVIFFRHCIGGEWVNSGPLWGCILSDEWEQCGDQPFHSVVTPYSCAKGSDPKPGNCEESLETCNSAGLDFVNNPAVRKASAFISKELSSEARAIQHLYIRHSSELEKIFTSKAPEYQKIQEEYDLFLEDIQPMLIESFLLDQKIPMGDDNIQRALNLINSISAVVENKNLNKALDDISIQLEKEKEDTKTVKEFLSNYGK